MESEKEPSSDASAPEDKSSLDSQQVSDIEKPPGGVAVPPSIDAEHQQFPDAGEDDATDRLPSIDISAKSSAPENTAATPGLTADRLPDFLSRVEVEGDSASVQSQTVADDPAGADARGPHRWLAIRTGRLSRDTPRSSNASIATQ